MEYYFYIVLIFAIILKLTLYLCWYQVRRNAAAKEVRIIMPDGSIRYALVTNASRSANNRATSEERQCLPQADSLASPTYDNQGMVERPMQPRFMGPGGAISQPYPVAPPDPATAGFHHFGDSFPGLKLPKYEELDSTHDVGADTLGFTGAPPPYTPPMQPQVDSQGMSCTVEVEQPTQYVIQSPPPQQQPAADNSINSSSPPSVGNAVTATSVPSSSSGPASLPPYTSA